MADKIFRPHRGTKTFMEDAGTVLADGELFFEVPDLGVGQGTCNIKMGDGSTAYKDLPYAINVPETTMNFTTSSTSSNSDLLDEISAGKSLSDLIGSIKKLLSNLDSGKADTNHASSSTTYGGGTASNYGHVKLSDTYTSSSGAAADSVAASNKALYDAYTTLNTSVSSLESSITSINNDLSIKNTSNKYSENYNWRLYYNGIIVIFCIWTDAMDFSTSSTRLSFPDGVTYKGSELYFSSNLRTSGWQPSSTNVFLTINSNGIAIGADASARGIVAETFTFPRTCFDINL